MNRKKISKRMALIFSTAFICCSIPPNAMETHAANTDESQNESNLIVRIQGEEGDNILDEIVEIGHKNEVPKGYTPIHTIEDLYGISNNPEENYILMADIDLSGTKPGGDLDTGYGWQPIEKFSGVLDGNGYRITNMSIYGNPPVQKVGLFSELSGTVQNLGVINVDIHPSGNVNCIGGITGYIDGAIIKNCYVTGMLQKQMPTNESKDNISDIYDEFDTPDNLYTIKCDIGGIAGDGNYFFSVKDCYTDVDLIGSGYVGGIMGHAERMLILRCYATGTVQSSIDFSGAITADIGDEFGIVKNSYYLASNGKDKYASELSNAQMKFANCYTGFDFDKTWIMDKNSPYPYPQLRSCMQVRTESIELLSPPDKLTYTEGETLDFTGSKLKLNYEDGYSVEIPLNESIVSYEMEAGNQTVNINYNGKSAQFDINVKPIPESLKVTAKKTKLKVGSSFTYKAAYTGKGAVTFESSNKNVLRIDRTSGKASAKKAGKVTVTIKGGSKKKAIKVTVVKK